MFEVVEVGRELQDHGESRSGHRASQYLFDDCAEVEVHVVTRNVELHSGKLTRLRAAVDRLYE